LAVKPPGALAVLLLEEEATAGRLDWKITTRRRRKGASRGRRYSELVAAMLLLLLPVSVPMFVCVYGV
jgi:hypothetical protein